jgi:hypothetical protein
VALLGWHDRSQVDLPSAEAATSSASLALVLGLGRRTAVSAGAQVRQTDAGPTGGGPGAPAGKFDRLHDGQGFEAGATASFIGPVSSHLDVDVRGELNTAWAESALTVAEGGSVTGVTAHAYVFPLAGWTRRILIDAGSQVRRLSLAPRFDSTPEATQLLLFGGADFVLWQDPATAITGESLDEEMRAGRYLGDSVVFSFRHYELFTEAGADFQPRINLIRRASVNSGSIVIRKALLAGRLGLEGRGLVGYDPPRERLLSQGGISVLFAPTPSSRISAGYDIAAETATGLAGRMQTGWLTYHVDL